MYQEKKHWFILPPYNIIPKAECAYQHWEHGKCSCFWLLITTTKITLLKQKGVIDRYGSSFCDTGDKGGFFPHSLKGFSDGKCSTVNHFWNRIAHSFTLVHWKPFRGLGQLGQLQIRKTHGIYLYQTGWQQLTCWSVNAHAPPRNNRINAASNLKLRETIGIGYWFGLGIIQ